MVNYTSVNYSSAMHVSPGGTAPKPPHLFGRDAEWAGLVAFAADTRPGATLGVVSGRRRQGKSYLLQALATALGGIYFPALEMTETVSLRLFADELIRFSGSPVPPFRDWLDAIPYLFRLTEDRVVPVVIDEFPFLAKASPGLPSIIARELGPGGSAAASRVRLLLCGSAMSVMGGLLSGPAPLRGRAGLELIVQPFGYRDAARFWDIADPRLALLVHSVVGGTPAYRRELLREDTPAGLADFDPWVVRTVLNPQTPLFREARYLLAEETEIRDPSLYHSVLAAVAEGNNTSGGIASYIGRKSNEVAHPLRVLEDSRLLIKEPDLFRSGRARYRIAEPLITFYQAIMSREWARLELGGGTAVWPGARARFLSQVTGPHFEAVCRDYAVTADPGVFGAPPGEVGSGVVSDPANRTQIQIDVAVLAPAEHGRPRRVLSLGEVKWDRIMGPHHVERLRRARDLLAVKGFDTRDTLLTCYCGAGFDRELRADQRRDIRLIGLDELYADLASWLVAVDQVRAAGGKVVRVGPEVGDPGDPAVAGQLEEAQARLCSFRAGELDPAGRVLAFADDPLHGEVPVVGEALHVEPEVGVPAAHLFLGLRAAVEHVVGEQRAERRPVPGLGRGPVGGDHFMRVSHAQHATGGARHFPEPADGPRHRVYGTCLQG
jgi:AAA+ ATPase superfamily predicted ATPase